MTKADGVPELSICRTWGRGAVSIWAEAAGLASHVVEVLSGRALIGRATGPRSLFLSVWWPYLPHGIAVRLRAMVPRTPCSRTAAARPGLCLQRGEKGLGVGDGNWAPIRSRRPREACRGLQLPGLLRAHVDATTAAGGKHKYHVDN